MTNKEFLEYILAPIVNVDGYYYAYVPTIFGYSEGYNKGAYVLLHKDTLTKEDLNEYLEMFKESSDSDETENQIRELLERIEQIENRINRRKLKSLLNEDIDEDGETEIDESEQISGEPEETEDPNTSEEQDETEDPNDSDEPKNPNEDEIPETPDTPDIYIFFPNNIDPESTFETINYYNIVRCGNHLFTTNYEYYAKLNDIYDKYELTEDQVNNARTTFAQIIDEYAYVTDISIKTEIYKKVIKYYANGMVDDVFTSLSMIMKSTSYSQTMGNTLSTGSCGCTGTQGSSSLLDPTQQVSCPEAYTIAMDMYMKQMFADLDFYYDFMFLDVDMPNEVMIQKLIDLLEALLDMDYPMNFNQTSSGHCCCAELQTKNNEAYSAINNYIKVLKWVMNCEIEENANKIKLYGSQFAEIYPYLIF